MFINIDLEKKILSKEDISSILCDCFEVDSQNDFDKAVETKVVSFVNPYSYSIISGNYNAVCNVDYWFCDGALMSFFTSFRQRRKIERASFDFSSIATDVFSYSEKCGLKVGVVGASDSEINKAVINLTKTFPNLNLAYFRDGYIDRDDFNSTINAIVDNKVDILIVGMGTPIQEEFAIHCKNIASKIKLVFTCGGFLTQTSVRADYYYPWIKMLGLRWLQRAVQEPHVRKRIFLNYPVFVFRYLFNV